MKTTDTRPPPAHPLLFQSRLIDEQPLLSVSTLIDGGVFTT